MSRKHAASLAARTLISYLVFLIFMSVIIFQVTAFKFIWNIEFFSRIVNTTILVWASAYFTQALICNKYNKKVYTFYIVPGLFIYLGYFVNLVVNSISNISVINQFGLLLPWALYLAVPQFMKRKVLNSAVLWRYYYYFMFAALVLSLIEYVLMLYGMLGLRDIMTSGGPFLAARFSIFHKLQDGSVHYRFYSSFLEPGTLAMYLLPAISYAFFYKKHLGLIVFSVAFVLADSLGGYFSLAILITIFAYIYFAARGRTNIFILLLFFTASLFYLNFSENLWDKYEQKQNSATVRERNFINFTTNLPNLMLNYPIGFVLEESSERASLNEDYFGSNFTIGNAFMLGGISAFLGYVTILLVSFSCSVKSLFCINMSREEKVVFSSVIALLPFVVQRDVVWDSASFAFLFAPAIVRFLQSRRISGIESSHKLL